MKAKSPLAFLTRRKTAANDTASGGEGDIREDEREAPRFESHRDNGYGTTRDSIGPLLRQTRESFGYDLQRISQALRIRYLYLDAIEKGNFERLPGPAYAVGFIRSYADFLGLDSDKILEFYKRDVQVPVGDSAYHFPEPVNESKVPGVAIIALCLLLGVVGYGSWYYASQSDGEVVDIIPEVPERLKVLLEPEEQEVEQVIADATAESAGGTPALTAEPQADGAVEQPAAAIEAPAPEPSEPQSGETVSGESSAVEGASEAAPREAAPVEASPGAEPPAETAESQAAETAAPESVVALDDDEISALIDQMVGGDEEASAGVEPAPSPPQAAAEPASDSAGTAAAAPAPADSSEAITAGTDDAVAAAAPEGTQLAEIPAVPSAGASGAADLAPEPQVYGDESEEVRVVLRALEDCWVQVRDESGNLLLTRVLRPGDVYRVPNKENLSLLAGNAGGLEVMVDGRPLPPLGPEGAVRRDVSLNVDALLGGTANLQ